MKEGRAFLHSSALYLVGGGLSKAVPFLLLPLYTSRVSPEAYGLYDRSLAAAALLGSLLYMDIWSGILRFLYEEGDGPGKLRPAAAGGVLFLGSSALYCALVAAISPRFGLVHPLWLCLYGGLNALSQATGSVARGLSQNVRYMAGGLCGTVVAAGANLVLLLLFSLGYEALYVSACLGYGVTSVVHLASRRTLRLLRTARVSRKMLSRMLSFSAPLCLNSAAYWFLTGYSRMVVAGSLGVWENGLYAVAGKFGLMVTLLMRCFQLAWQELSFSKGGLSRKERGDFFSGAARAYLRATVWLLVLLLPALRVMFPAIVSGAYGEAYRLVPGVLLAMGAAAASEFLGSVFAAIKRTRLLFATTVAGALVNVAALWAGIGRFGVQAAGASLFLGFLAAATLRGAVLSRQTGLRIRAGDLAGPLLCLAAQVGGYFALGPRGNAGTLAAALLGLFVLYRKPLVRRLRRAPTT